MMENTYSAPGAKDVEDGKAVAVLSYITLIGWLIAFIMNSSNKTKFGAFHLRQGLGLMIIAFGFSVIMYGILVFMPLLFLVFPAINIAILVFAILGIINAANGKMQGLPLIGDFCEKTFSGIQ